VLGGGDPGDKVMGEESWQGEVLGKEILAGKVGDLELINSSV
jgi:hypothetical protein